MINTSTEGKYCSLAFSWMATHQDFNHRLLDSKGFSLLPPQSLAASLPSPALACLLADKNLHARQSNSTIVRFFSLSFLNGRTWGFHPQNQKLEPPFRSKNATKRKYYSVASFDLQYLSLTLTLVIQTCRWMFTTISSYQRVSLAKSCSQWSTLFPEI